MSGGDSFLRARGVTNCCEAKESRVGMARGFNARNTLILWLTVVGARFFNLRRIRCSTTAPLCVHQLMTPTPNSRVKLRIRQLAEGLDWSKKVSIEIQDPLRILAERREVWLAYCEEYDAHLVAKRFLPGSKQMREFNREVSGLKELSQRGIPGPGFIFTAEDDASGLWVAAKYIENGQSLFQLFFADDNTHSQSASKAINEFAKTLVLHWKSGVHQTDVHFKNFYWDGSTVYTLDVGSIRFKSSALSQRLIRKISYKLGMRFSGAARKMFFESLASHAAAHGVDFSYPSLPQQDKESAKALIREAHRLWKKSFRSSSRVLSRRSSDSALLASRSMDSELVEMLYQDPDSFMSQGLRLKNGNTCTVQKIEWKGQSFVLKRYNQKSLSYRLRHLLHLSRARRSWGIGQAIGVLGINVPQPLVLVEQKKNGMTLKSWLLMEFIDASSIDQRLKENQEMLHSDDSALKEISALFQKMHRYRIVHGDLKANNLLVNNEQIYLIDCDSLRFDVPKWRFKREAENDLKRFLENWDANTKLKKRIQQVLRKD